MSFLSNLGSIFAKIGHGVLTGAAAASAITSIPAIGQLVALVPGGSVAITILHYITDIEAQYPFAGIGQAKNTIVTAATVAQHPGLDPAVVSLLVTEIVTSLNKATALQLALKPVPVITELVRGT